MMHDRDLMHVKAFLRTATAVVNGSYARSIRWELPTSTSISLTLLTLPMVWAKVSDRSSKARWGHFQDQRSLWLQPILTLSWTSDQQRNHNSIFSELLDFLDSISVLMQYMVTNWIFLIIKYNTDPVRQLIIAWTNQSYAYILWIFD